MPLTTPARVRDQSEGAGIPASQDTLLTQIIAAAGEAIAKFCAYPPPTSATAPTMELSSYVRYSGDPDVWVDPDETRKLYLAPWPVVVLSEIAEDELEVFGGDTVVASGDYSQRGGRGGTILLTPASTQGTWSVEPLVIRATFTAGFDTSAGYASTEPQLEQAAISLTLHWYNLKQRRGLQSAVQADLNTSYRDETIPAFIRQQLSGYLLPSALVG